MGHLVYIVKKTRLTTVKKWITYYAQFTAIYDKEKKQII